ALVLGSGQRRGGTGEQSARPGRGQVVEQRRQVADPLGRGHLRRAFAVLVEVEPAGTDVLGENVEGILTLVVAQPHVAHRGLSSPIRGAVRGGTRGAHGGGCRGSSRVPRPTCRWPPARSARR